MHALQPSHAQISIPLQRHPTRRIHPLTYARKLRPHPTPAHPDSAHIKGPRSSPQNTSKQPPPHEYAYPGRHAPRTRRLSRDVATNQAGKGSILAEAARTPPASLLLFIGGGALLLICSRGGPGAAAGKESPHNRITNDFTRGEGAADEPSYRYDRGRRSPAPEEPASRINSAQGTGGCARACVGIGRSGGGYVQLIRPRLSMISFAANGKAAGAGETARCR